MNRQQQIIKTYLKIAKTISELSRCNKAKVGAVIVNDNNIVAYGYNGTPSGYCNTCEDENNKTFKEVIHAETNAILKAGRLTVGADLYLTLSPCIDCCKLIKQSGIKHVYFLTAYKDLSGLEKFKIPYTKIHANIKTKNPDY